jgi:hypothetical protein
VHSVLTLSARIADAAPSRALRCMRTMAALLVACALAPGVSAQAPNAGAASERGVKAAFVYKFLGYIEWPATAFARSDVPIVVGVAGGEELASELAEIVRGRAAGNRPVEVRRLRAGDALAGVNVLVISAAERGRAAQLVRAAHARGILTITETEDGLEQGSVINLVIVDGRVRFEVSLEAAERVGVKLSSRLLAVAHLVRMGSN